MTMYDSVSPTNVYDNTDMAGWRSQDTMYNSFAGTDIVAQIQLPGEGPITIGELQTISYSIHRENTPVRTLGRTNPVSHVKGSRTIAGSLIFTAFDEYAFYRTDRFKRAIAMGYYPLSDMLPPFDVVLTFANEYGVASTLKILGVTIVDEGQTMSIDDLITEQTYTYMARGIQPLMRYDNTPPAYPTRRSVTRGQARMGDGSMRFD